MRGLSLLLYSHYSTRNPGRQDETSGAESRGVLQRASCRQPRVALADVVQDRQRADKPGRRRSRSQDTEFKAADAALHVEQHHSLRH